MTDKIEVRVSRPFWWRGDKSLLLQVRGNRMCCLGFAARQLGATEDEIHGLESPAAAADRSGVVKQKLEPLIHVSLAGNPYNSSWTSRAMDINDNEFITEERRELELRQHFASTESPFAGIVFED